MKDTFLLREKLPQRYAEILFKKYRKNGKEYSKSLIYKVARGERRNAIILGDLMNMAEQHQLYLKRVRRFDKRIKKAKKHYEKNIHIG